MIVNVNGEDVKIFKGATAKHAALKYILKNKMDASQIDNIKFFDANGRKIGSDAPMTEGKAITFKI